MREQHNEPLNDALAREIEQALSIEPSPEFQARVRQRVARELPLAEAAFGWWHQALGPASALVATAVIIIAGWQFGSLFWMGDERAGVEPTRLRNQPDPRQQPAQSVAATATPPAATQGRMQSTAQDMAQSTTARPGLRGVQPPSASATLNWLAPVIVAEDEIAGMRTLIADAQAGRFEGVVVSEEAVAPVVAVVTAPGQVADASDEASSATLLSSASAAEAAELAHPNSAEGMPQARMPQMASAVLVRPLVIEPLTIKPVVQNLPDETPEGAAE